MAEKFEFKGGKCMSRKTSKIEPRKEDRDYKRFFVELNSTDKNEDLCMDALIVDESDSGLALITYIPLPIGTRVKIRTDNDIFAAGEVINIDRWDYCGLVRLGVHYLEKGDRWPL